MDTALDCRQLVVRIGDRLFGISIDTVQEMLELPALTTLPGVPNCVRGVMNLRGRVVPVLDLRVALGMSQLTREVEALCAQLGQRQEEHHRWLSDLEAAIDQHRRFTGESDPARCPFGKWHAEFQTANRQIAAFMSRFEKPHQRIHALAHEVQALLNDGKEAAARELVASVRSVELAALNQLFEQLPTMIRASTREVAVLLKADGKEFGVSVDEVVAVETLSKVDDRHEVLDSFGMSNMASGIAKRTDDKLVLLLNIEALTEGVFAAAAER